MKIGLRIARHLFNSWQRLWQGWTVGVFGVVITEDKKILLVRSLEGWGLPGGGVLFKKDQPCCPRRYHPWAGFLNTLAREVKEETGILCLESSFLKVFPSYLGKDIAFLFWVSDYREPKIKKGKREWFSQKEVESLPILGIRMKGMIDEAFEASKALKSKQH